MKTFVVDDDQRNRERVCRMLEAAGHTTCRFGTADEALVILDEPEGDVRLVVTDVQMPGVIDGIDLASLLASARPGLPVVVMSSDPGELQRAARRGLTVPTIAKPFESPDLLAAVSRAEGGPNDPPEPDGNGACGDVVPTGLADPRPMMRRMHEEAAAEQHAHVGSEHVALAAIDGPGGLAEIAERSGIDPSALRPALQRCCRRPPVLAEPGFTARTALMLSIAGQLALLDQSPVVRPCHLVTALLTAPTCTAWGGLTAIGLSPEMAAMARRGQHADS